MKLINLTPHLIRIRVNTENLAAEPDATDIVVSPSGTPARVASSLELKFHEFLEGDGDSYNAVPIYAQTYGEVENLPPPQTGVRYFVSGLVLSALKAQGITRDDVRVPVGDPKKTVRNSDGLVYAVFGLVE